MCASGDQYVKLIGSSNTTVRGGDIGTDMSYLYHKLAILLTLHIDDQLVLS